MQNQIDPAEENAKNTIFAQKRQRQICTDQII